MARRLTDLKELGVAWAEKTLTDDALAAWRKANKPRQYKEPVMLYTGDRPVCPCGKVSYRTKREALDVAGGYIGAPPLGRRPYVCPLGHPVYHLKSSGRSTREDDRR